MMAQNQFEFGRKPFRFVGSLEYFDGTLSAVVEGIRSRQIWYLRWVDVSDNFHRWLFFPVSARSLRLYLDGKFSDDDLFWLDPSETVALLELNGNMETGKSEEILKTELPEDFKPSPEGFFEPNLCPDLEKIEQFLRQFSPAVERKSLQMEPVAA